MRNKAKKDYFLSHLEAHCKKLEKEFGAFMLQIDFSEVLILVSQLQLALRHPQNTGLPAKSTRRLIDGIIHALDNNSPGIGKILAMGDNPQHDVTQPK